MDEPYKERHRFLLVLPHNLIDQLREQAYQQRKSLTAYIQCILERELEKVDESTEPTKSL